MINVYDIILNFNKDIIHFYEWSSFDNLLYFKKIPLFRIDKKLLTKIVNYKVKIEKKFIDLLENKSEIIDDNMKISPIRYCLFSDKENVIGVYFDEFGYIIKRSEVSISDELEIIGLVSSIKPLILEYEVFNKLALKNISRREMNMNKRIKNFINSITNPELIRYLRYEIDEKESENKKELYDLIIKENYKRKKELLEVMDQTKKA